MKDPDQRDRLRSARGTYPRRCDGLWSGCSRKSRRTATIPLAIYIANCVRFATGLSARSKARFLLPAFPLLLPLAVYATVIALTADSRVIYGWYRIPLYPFLCVASGVLLEEMLEQADLYSVFPFAVAAVSTGAIYAWAESPALFQGKAVVALFGLVAMAPYLARLAFERPFTARLARATTWLLFLFFLFTNLRTIDRLLEIYSATRGR